MDKNIIQTHFMTGKAYKGYIYAACYEYNGLYKINISTGEVHFISVFPGEEIICKSLYRDSVLMNGKIYFFPDSAKNISVYDINNESFYTITIPNSQKERCGYNAIEYKDRIMLIPINLSNDVLIYDTTTSAFLKNECPDKLKDFLTKHCSENVYRIGLFKSFLTIPIGGKNNYFVYDLVNDDGYEGETESSISAFISNDLKSRLITADGTVWDLEEEKLAYNNSYKTIGKNLVTITGNQEEMFLFDREENDTYFYNLNENEISNRNIMNKDEMIWYYTDSILFFRDIRYEKVQIVMSVNLSGFILWDGNRYIYRKFTGLDSFPDILLQYMHQELQKKDNIFEEYETFGLETFLSIL